LQQSAVAVVGSVTLPQPKTVTINQLINGAFQSQRVLIANARFPQANGSNTFAGERTIEDATGVIVSATAGTAPFANEVLPSGNTTVVGVPGSSLDQARLIIMQFEDVGGGGGGGATGPAFGLPFFRAFNDCTVNFSIPADFIEEIVPGSKTDRGWGCHNSGFNSSQGIRASSFGGAVGTDHTWLITERKLNFSGASNPKIEFWVQSNFTGDGVLKFYYSENYPGSGNPLNSTWVEIPELAAQLPDKGSAASGAKVISVNVAALAGKQAFIAFQWQGGTNASSASYTIDNLNITAN
jgi:hypothetical protein